MVMKWYNENRWAAVLITLVRVYLGWQWLDAGWHKLTGKEAFDASGFIKGAVAKPVADHATNAVIYPNYTYFLEHVVTPSMKLINILIPIGETLIGLGLILGGFTLVAGFFGLVLNFLFLFAGTVSTNPWLLLLGVIVFLAGTNAGRFGIDRYLNPLVQKGWNRVMNKTNKDQAIRS
ncbi:hypothetical protein Back11_54820 [Paenibacillus baekrokdamisoli]|uniref:Uncharacterized protein n=1 Tax=Paenibacillus baekrokdamisoli TaxID=1712516 RepID=A0A3G9IYY2_9BACL|nr:DoxX family protein [Paenibacillus baekrokdamisoli]MBB3071880.1 thiosulfate dehydrogenase [quinone] large subunit [Paenibacillus baekrokdamisoli]BBH24137.1 hypothetical protein Back11_54820 [Paenibacillus baekrokdamisoli]